MTKTYTGPEFEVEYYRAMLAWVSGGKQGESPNSKWESSDQGGWLNPTGRAPFFDATAYRWAPPPPHKWADIIKAYADDPGIYIEVGYSSGYCQRVSVIEVIQSQSRKEARAFKIIQPT